MPRRSKHPPVVNYDCKQCHGTGGIEDGELLIWGDVRDMLTREVLYQHSERKPAFRFCGCPIGQKRRRLAMRSLSRP